MPRIRVLRSYLERGAVRKVGEVVDVPASFARELVHSGKAEFHAEPAAAPEPLTTESAEALVSGGRARKEK